MSEPTLRRSERWALAVFLALDVLVPWRFEELYPFSRVGIFTDAPRVMAVYELRDPGGALLDPGDFGLGRDYVGARGYDEQRPGPHPQGLALPATLDRMGVVPSPEAFVATVARHLGETSLPFVDAALFSVGPDPGGALQRHLVISQRVQRGSR